MLVSAVFNEREQQFDYVIVSDSEKPLKKVTMEISEHRFNSKNSEAMYDKVIKIPELAPQHASVMKPYKKSWYCEDIHNCFLRFTLRDHEGKMLSQEHVYPKGLGAMKKTEQPALKLSLEPADDTTFQGESYPRVKVTVENVRDGASTPAIFTSLTLDNDITSHTAKEQLRGFFSENVFNLLPGESRSVLFTAKNKMSGQSLLAALEKQIKARSYNEMLRLV